VLWFFAQREGPIHVREFPGSTALPQRFCNNCQASVLFRLGAINFLLRHHGRDPAYGLPRSTSTPGVSCGEACFSFAGASRSHRARPRTKFAHPLAYPSFDRIEPVVEQINRCVGGGGPTATFSGISAVGREGEARWLATADGERPRLSQGCASQPKLLVGRHGARGRRAT
jgi:hypothetical protein